MNPAPAPLLKVEHLHKKFGNSVALHDVSFAIERGEIVGFLGPNGAGKTTAIAILLGLISPTSGTVELFGMNLERNRVQVLQRCNFSSAYVSLPTNMSVVENLRVFAEMYAVRDAKRKIASLLDQLEIAHLAHRVTGQLSAGESTRVNLAKALLNEPELLLLDEPTASLDPDMADKVRKLLKRIQQERNITMLYTSHNMKDVEEICSRVLFLRKGSLIAEGSPRAIMQRFQETTLEGVFLRVARDGDLEEQEEPSV